MVIGNPSYTVADFWAQPSRRGDKSSVGWRLMILPIHGDTHLPKPNPTRGWKVRNSTKTRIHFQLPVVEVKVRQRWIGMMATSLHLVPRGKAAERSVDGLWNCIAILRDAFSPNPCADDFAKRRLRFMPSGKCC